MFGRSFLLKMTIFGQQQALVNTFCHTTKSVFIFRCEKADYLNVIGFLAIKMIKFSILISGDDGKITFWSLFGSLGMKN